MKVGDYVRFKNGTITKINSFSEKDNPLFNILINAQYYNSSDIKVSSPNIINLILPMDLMYIDILPDNCGGIVVPRIPETYCELEQIINEIKLRNYVLKGIVTKEQLIENMYKVESEVN